MSAFFESLHRQANDLQSIEEQRAFYEQQAGSLPAGYAYGYDSAAHLEELAATGGCGLAMPTFLHEQDGSLQGFLDYLAVPSRNDLHIASFVIRHALKYFSEQSELCDVLVITRGGGSADDLAAFGHEQVVRAVAASRVPTLVAIGHEIDLSLAELAADARASTPSNAAELLVPDKKDVLLQLSNKRQWLQKGLLLQLDSAKTWLSSRSENLHESITTQLKKQQDNLQSQAKLLDILSPQAALKRGYALVRQNGKVIKNANMLTIDQQVTLQFYDGERTARVE